MQQLPKAVQYVVAALTLLGILGLIDILFVHGGLGVWVSQYISLV